MELCGALWSFVELCGALWSFVELCGALRSYCSALSGDTIRKTTIPVTYYHYYNLMVELNLITKVDISLFHSEK